jgi:hypothetical protein
MSLRKLLPLAIIGLVAALAIPALAFDPADPAMQKVWQRYDKPIVDGVASNRSWMWGPGPNTAGIFEPYAESPGGQRLVQYYDKSRMEINRTDVTDPNHPWYVTNGLLSVELITGRIQKGNASFENRGCGAAIPIAGDPGNTWPTYRGLSGRINTTGAGAPNRTGQYATEVLNPDGSTGPYPGGNDPGAQLVYYEASLGHNIPKAFWDFMNATGTIYSEGSYVAASPWFDRVFVMGWPIGEPYWALVKVGGVDRWVLFQPYERRVLTYTPSNPDPWKVEMGNIGQHYYRWRYEGVGAPCPGPGPSPTPTPSPTATPTPTTVYDFVDRANHALWTGYPSGVTLPFPGSDIDSRGFALWRSGATMEGGTTVGRCLETHPQWVDNGSIQGTYTELYSPIGYVVNSRDRFQATVGLLQGAAAGNVRFKVMVRPEGGTNQWIADIVDAYGDGLKQIDVGLASWAGKRADFILEVHANGSSGQDWACWVSAKILRYP